MSERFGGPSGDHARPHRWWTPVRLVLAAFTLVFALGMVQHEPCVTNHWNSNSVRYSKMCYSDIPYLYTSRGFAERRWPFTDDTSRYPALEYPVGIGYLAWAASWVTSLDRQGPPYAERARVSVGALWGLPGMDREINLYFWVTALLLFGCGLGAAYFLAGAHPGRPYDAIGFALSPVLFAVALTNWDLLAVLFVGGAFWAWARGRSFLAGLFIGLGVATKLYPLLLLGAFAVVCVRRRRWMPVLWMVLGCVLSWAVVNVPAMVTGWSSWKVFWTFNSGRGADLGSLWYAAQLSNVTVSAHEINVVSWLVVGVVCVLVLVLGLTTPEPPRPAQLAFLLVLGLLVVNKVYSPQYMLWLLPLAVLARPRWRDLLIWQSAELAYFGAVWLFLGNWLQDNSGTSSPAYQAAIAVRVAGELYLAVLVVWDLYHPERDPARGVGLGPAGAPLPRAAPAFST